MSQSRKLRDLTLQKAYDETMSTIYRAIDAFPWEDPRAYAMFLAQSYHMTKSTTRVAALTAGSFTLEEAELHEGSLDHLREEHHHERMAEKDIENLGFSLEDFPELSIVEAMVQSQYYFIHRHPSAHFGYVLALETIANDRGPFILENTRRFGKEANSFVEVHALVDQQHVLDMIRIVDRTPEWILPHLGKNLTQTGLWYSEMVRQSAAWADARRGKKAA